MSKYLARPEHQVAYQDLAVLLHKHADKVPAMELLAIAANMVGKLVAMQDERTVSCEMAMELVAENIEQGNHEAVAQMERRKEWS